MEKDLFAHLNKLFEIDTAEWAYNIFLSDKNLQALIENPKPFIIPMFHRLAHPSLVPNEYFMLKDLPFYEIAHSMDYEGRQAHLQEREKKC